MIKWGFSKLVEQTPIAIWFEQRDIYNDEWDL